MRRLPAFALIVLLLPDASFSMERVYQTQDELIAEVFGSAPAPKVLWLTHAVEEQVTNILGHPPRQLRQRYWSDGAKTLWILEEIGKEEPITAAFVVQDGKIGMARVLVYRESRGGEVRFPAFLNQFKGAALNEKNYLGRDIDGISGATLSVQAMQRMARTALYFDRVSRSQ
ncbi:MAG: FMN-binding protein [Burkholderiales bacterium]